MGVVYAGGWRWGVQQVHSTPIYAHLPSLDTKRDTLESQTPSNFLDWSRFIAETVHARDLWNTETDRGLLWLSGDDTVVVVLTVLMS